MKKKIALSGILGLFLLSGIVFFPYYTYHAKNDSYKNDYSLQEVNQKILKMQNRIALKMQKSLNSNPFTKGTRRIVGNFGGSMKGKSPLGGGGGNISVKNIDIQKKEKYFDIKIDNLKMSGWMNMLEGNSSVDSLHIIGNASGSYLKSENIVYDIPEDIKSQIPESLIMTLNFLGKNNQYINLDKNITYGTFSKQIHSQNEGTIKLQNLMISILKNENIFIVEHQEDAKYHLIPSKSICKLIKNKRNNTQKPSNKAIKSPNILALNDRSFIPNYDEFKNNFVECNEDEYKEMIERFKLFEGYTLKDFYVELSPFKTHLVAKIDIDNREEGEENLKISLGYDGIFTLTDVEKVDFYIKAQNPILSGSGILYQSIGKNITGYIDFDIKKYGFESGIFLSGTTDNILVNGDYSLESPKNINDSSLKIHEGLTLDGEITGNIMKGKSNIEIKQKFSLESQMDISGEITTKIQNFYTTSSNSGAVTINGMASIGEDANPISGESSLKWESNLNNVKIYGKHDFNLNIPNATSGEYKMNYNFDMSQSVDSNFTTPEKVVSQKKLNFLFKINEKKLNKEKEGNKIQLKDEKLHVWNGEETLVGDKPENININSLKFIQGIYIKDKSHVYEYSHENKSFNLVDWANVKSFQIIETNNKHKYYLKDEKNIYYSEYGSLQKIERVDVNSFGLLDDNGDFYKDKNGIYSKGRELKGVDPDSFHSFSGTDFFKDKNGVYLNGEIIENADPESFKHVEGSSYYLDKNNVYYVYGLKGKVLEGISPKNFIAFDLDYIEQKVKGYSKKQGYSKEGGTYFKNSDGIFFHNREIIKIEGVDMETFDIIIREVQDGFSRWRTEGYAKDKNKVYYHGKEINGVIPEFFEIIGGGYSKDSTSIFYGVHKLTGVGIDGFEIVYDKIIKNNKYVFLITPKKLTFVADKKEGIDMKSFQKIRWNYYKDKNFVYDISLRIKEKCSPSDVTKENVEDTKSLPKECQ